MSPLVIEMLLHYHCCAREFERIHAPACSHARTWLLSNGLIEQGREYAGYTTTDRGKALVTELCATPLPTCRWVFEREQRP